MTVSFIPRDIHFWVYHLLALGMVIAVDIITSMQNGQVNVNVAKVSGLFVILFTLATLGFRYVFKTYGWYKVAYHRQIPSLLCVGTVLSVVVTGGIITISYATPYFSTIYNSYIGEQVTLGASFSSAFMFKQILQTQLFICSWIFIYTSITHQRHASSEQLKSLELENLLKSAQLENLNTQLNPHFLFNSLNNIRFMIAESVDLADEMMVTLSELLRYALEMARLEKVSLRTELEMLNKYMQLIKIQYEDKLTFHTHINDGNKTWLIPPMMLQLLLENAVKYGVERSTQAGEINLTVEQSEHTLMITLANTLPTQSDESIKGVQVGLANIRSRLSLLYDEDATFNTHIIDNQFVATLTLPKEHS